MGWRAVLVLLVIQAILPSLQPGAAGDWLSPAISPILKGLCNAVECGRGSCRVDSNSMLGYACECDQGWTKLTRDDQFQYLPCVIPNCTLNYSCSNITMAPAPSLPPLPPSDHSLFDPCSWTHCGEGNCVKTSQLGYRCDCNPGSANLLNATNFPCIRECALGGNCSSLGIVLPINGSSPSVSQSDQSGTAANTGATTSPGSLMWILLLMLSVAVALRS